MEVKGNTQIILKRPDPGYYLLNEKGEFLGPDDRPAFETADEAAESAIDEIIVEVIG
jgi:hypothetical protein